jgi:AcrR family transcriptional regulator
VLNRDGVSALSTRSVASEAQVNLSLIHYYFGSREGLLLALLERMDEELLARQRAMYGEPAVSLAAKWRQAIEFYRQDLKSGYVRTLLELAAHGYSNPRIAAEMRKLLSRWRGLLIEVATEALAGQEAPLEAAEIGSLITSYWYGMEMQHLLGVPEKEGKLWQTLAKIGDLIERWETRERQA